MSIIERAVAKAKHEDRAAVEGGEGLAHQSQAPTPEDGAPAGGPGSTMSALSVSTGLARETGDSSSIAPAPPGGSGLAREDGAPVREALVQAPQDVIFAPALAQAPQPRPQPAAEARSQTAAEA